MNDILKFPLYAKLTAVLLGLIALIFVLYIGQDILVLMMMSFILFAMYPIVQFLKSKLYFPHVLAVCYLYFVLFLLVFCPFIISNK
jgi:predicted PurR-regulated permease PerM